MPETDATPEPTEPTVTDVPEPDQEPSEPSEEQAEEQAEEERAEGEEAAQEPAGPSEAEGAQQAEWEQRFKRSERAFQTYTRKVSEIYADDAVNLIPVSISPSAPPGFIYKYDAGRVDDEVKAPILEFFGISREMDYAEDPETSTCRTCQGKGKTKTGSLVAGNESRTCRSCEGYGYTPPPSDSANGAARTVDLHAPAGERVQALSTGDVDNWGEPKILPDGRPNPNFGKMPDHKVPVEPWGITRNLTAMDAQV